MTVQPHDAQANSLASIHIDEAEVLKRLRLTPEAILVCQRYDLDPVRKHVVIVDGNAYVTRDGLLRIAHRSGTFDGLEVEEARLDEATGEWRSKASVYRKDMSRPFSFSGRYPKGKKNSPEMAEKVAVARALRHAFDVALPTDDERQASDTQPAATRLRPPAPAAVQPPPAAEPVGEVDPTDLLVAVQEAQDEATLRAIWEASKAAGLLDVVGPPLERRLEELRAAAIGERLVEQGELLNDEAGQ